MVRVIRGNRLTQRLAPVQTAPGVASKDDASDIGDTYDCDRAPGLLSMRCVIDSNLE